MKTNKLAAGIVFAMSCCIANSLAQNAPVQTNVIAESSVQYLASGATGFTNYISGYDKVKYSATTPCKSYLKFDFTGQNPNTNYFLKLSLAHAANAGSQHLQIWALNQSYTAFSTNGNTSAVTPAAVNPTLSWSGAQANDTSTNGSATGNDMLTTGGSTATFIADVFDGNSSTTFGSGTTIGFSIPAPWGQYLKNNQIVIVMATTNDAVDNSNGGRYQLGVTTATFQPLTAGTQPPTISSFSAQTVKSTQTSSLISFTVIDPLDSAASLTNFSILLGNTNVTFTSTNISSTGGGNRTLQFVPVSNLAAGQTASVTVTVTVTDSSGNSASSSFLLTVPPFISLPIVLSGTNVNYLPPTNRVGTGSLTIPFQIVDTNVAASSLVVTGAVSAYSTNLGAISFNSVTGIAPNTNNCTLTVNCTGKGVGIVNVSVIDQANLVTNTIPVAIMVLPSSSYAACDLMDYQPSTSYSSSGGHSDLAPASANIWAPRSASGSVNLIVSGGGGSGGAVPSGMPFIRGTSSGNQNQLRLAGAPYSANSHKVLFASFNVQWCDLSYSGANYYYPGASTGGFVEFAADGSATGVTMAQVCTVTNSANTATNSGTFYLGLYNGTNAPSLFSGYQEAVLDMNSGGLDPMDNVVISYDLDTGISQLWVNQPNSASTSASLQDVAVTNLANVSYLVLRQNALMGQILLESASVQVVNKSGQFATNSTINSVSVSGSNVVIKFTSGTGLASICEIQAASTVNGSYSADNSFNVVESPSGSGSYTATGTLNGSARFYRVVETTGTVTTPTVTFPF